MAKIKDAVIGKRIRQARQELSFTQEEVASAVGMSRDKFANIESGRTTCSLSDAKEICDFLGLEIQELLKSDESSLENMILFRDGTGEDDDQLLDLSDTIYRELMGQLKLYRENVKKEGQFRHV
ncbi:helix-turn-helix transcriptional regulator [Paenibacillus sp. N4]|uniref:helix-turn-helix domain-containing protein n=1 Tax=Paenibacillus vietnamensis TaxID=2590547 RepID=UPI001CD10B2C|nr:helix-turn-helix transcriptional regulator [Paenibacillus vietnamensis]MCA0757040.1 helix-turn-helix transcriptional regulator [Paenibacillus vietnamensis]